MRAGDPVFVDTGAWIALALTRDPLHARAVAAWDRLAGDAVRLHTSVPVILETFTFLQRNTSLDVALAWKTSLGRVRGLKILPCTATDLTKAWPYIERSDLHKLSPVDASSFVLMAERRIRRAFAFDSHFATAGFGMVG